MTFRDAIDVMRRTFNWLRHNDRPEDPQEAELDFHFEAGIIIDRAIENLFLLSKTVNKRAAEVVAEHRAHEAKFAGSHTD